MARFKRWIPVVAVLLVLTPVLWLAGRVAAFRAMGEASAVERGPFTVHGVACGAVGPKGPGCEVKTRDGRVVAVSGRSLESAMRPVLRAGDTLGKVRQVLGQPDEERVHGSVATRGTWRYARADLEIDFAGDVVERIRLGR